VGLWLRVRFGTGSATLYGALVSKVADGHSRPPDLAECQPFQDTGCSAGCGAAALNGSSGR